jgi:SnoaL-like domain
MSQEDLDRVRQAWAAISANDVEAFIEKIDPEVEFTSLVAEADALTYRGHVGVRKWWDSVREAFSELWASRIDLREMEDQILAEIRLCGTTRGMQIEQTIWQVLKVENGLVVRWAIYRTEEEALRGISHSRRRARIRGS